MKQWRFHQRRPHRAPCHDDGLIWHHKHFHRREATTAVQRQQRSQQFVLATMVPVTLTWRIGNGVIVPIGILHRVLTRVTISRVRYPPTSGALCFAMDRAILSVATSVMNIHWMVMALLRLGSLARNHVEYRGRFVETEYFLKEQEQDAILYRNTFGTQREGGILANALDVKLKNVANTNAVSFGDRLFAVWEAGKPYELDPNTLETFRSKIMMIVLHLQDWGNQTV